MRTLRSLYHMLYSTVERASGTSFANVLGATEIHRFKSKIQVQAQNSVIQKATLLMLSITKQLVFDRA